jgi:hypothetical protein
MSFHVNKKKKLDGTEYWRLLRSTWSNGKVKYEHIPSSQLLQYGLSSDLSLEDARTRVKQLNAQSRVDRDAEGRKASALKSQKQQEILTSAHLPKSFALEFTENYLRAEMAIGASGEAKYKKALSTWGYCQKLIVSVNLPQQHWHQHKRRFYGEMANLKTSPSYTGKVLRILNMWGSFIAMKTSTSFIPVPPPRGYDREMIADAYLDSDKRKKTSDPLSPDLLESNKGRFTDAQYRWLYLSVWLGLRPPEVDSLADSKVTREQGVSVLWIYQSKLRGVKKEDRYKPVPLIYPEQIKCLDFIKQEIKRPLVKTVQKHITDGINLYGGRKGFTDMMLDKGQSLEDISTWLGHATIERTWHSYKRRSKVSFKKTG